MTRPIAVQPRGNPNHDTDDCKIVEDVYKGQHKSHVPLALSTGVLQLSLRVFALRELMHYIANNAHLMTLLFNQSHI